MIDVIYCMSLERLDERRSHMIKFLSNVNFCPVYFFDAVDAKEYSWEDFHNEGIYEYKEWKLPKDQCYIRFDHHLAKVVGLWNRDVTRGEMGCSVGHYSIWKHAFENGFKNVLVFEDDIKCSIVHFMDVLNIFLTFIKNNDYDVFYFGAGTTVINDIKQVSDVVMQTSFAYCLHSYVINSKAIKVMLKSNYLKSLIPCDDSLQVFFGGHPREDIGDLYNIERKLNAFRVLRSLMIPQKDHEYEGSQTDAII